MHSFVGREHAASAVTDDLLIRYWGRRCRCLNRHGSRKIFESEFGEALD
jgi:hypothetical protein